MGNQVCAVFEYDSDDVKALKIQEEIPKEKSFKKSFSQDEDEFSGLEKENLWKSSNGEFIKPSWKNAYPFGHLAVREKITNSRIFEVFFEQLIFHLEKKIIKQINAKISSKRKQ